MAFQMVSKDLPGISVVVIAYNFEKYIKDCVESILSQTLRPFEIIVCDDCSTDRTWEIVNRFVEKFPRLVKGYRQEYNVGPFLNGSFGGTLARGNWICLMDGDDRWLPQKLELEWAAIQKHPDAQIAYSNVYTIDADGHRLDVWHAAPGEPPSGDVFVNILSRKFFSSPGSLFRNELMSRLAFEQEGHCDAALKSYWDWDRKIRLTARFKVAYSGAALVERRVHTGGFSKSQPEVHLQALVQIYEKSLPLLARHPIEDVLRVKVNIESTLCTKVTDSFAPPWLTPYTAQKALDRVMPLLGALPVVRRKRIEQELHERLARIILTATKEALANGNRASALKNYRLLLHYVSIFDLKYAQLGVQVILSERVVQFFRKVFKLSGGRTA